ncbi:MAG: SDR family oxidoreductase [Betaproteobacteria bacterium]|nr:SDR family oxidoreductase [Betaproteobacteria bacterium]
MLSIDLSGKKALVTGGSGGLGSVMSCVLAQAGAAVAVHYGKDAHAAARVVAQIRQAGGTAISVAANIADPEAVERLFQAVDQAFGGLDILINNAGADGPRASCADSDPAQWQATLAIDLTGPYLCARRALRAMLGQGRGVILNITSVHEFIPWAGFSAYTSAKAGLSMFTKTLAQEAVAKGVRVVALAPGAIKTPINEAVWRDPRGLADLDQKIAMGRPGDPQEVAQVAAFLVSDLASYVTGTTVAVDGGMLIYPDFRHGG